MTQSTPRARGRPTLDEAARLDQEIVEAALHEFLAHGYGGASLSRIVRKARISKTTLYARYATKEDLFGAVMKGQIDDAAAGNALRPIGEELDLFEGLSTFAKHMLDRSLEGQLLEVNRLILSESHRFPEIGRAAAQNTTFGIARIKDFISECRPELAANSAQCAAEAFIHMIRGWYMNQVLTSKNVSTKNRETWVENAVRIFVTSSDNW